MTDIILRRKLIVEYWVQKMSTTRPTSLPNAGEIAAQYAEVEFSVAPAVSKAITALSGKTIVGEYAIHLSLFALVIQKYYGLDDIHVLSSDWTLQRSTFIEHHPVFYTLRPRKDLTFLEYLRQTANELQQTYNNLEVDFSEVVRRQQSSPTGLGKFEFGFHAPGINAPSEPLRNTAILLSWMRADDDIPRFILRFDEAVLGNQFGDVFASQLKETLKNCTENVNSPLSSYSMISGEERARLTGYGHGKASDIGDSALANRFSKVVREHPDHVAVICEDCCITFSELNRRANKVAYALHGVSTEIPPLVGLHVRRRLELIVGMLGIIKAGSAYLPLDTGHPAGRNRAIADDANLTVVISDVGFPTDNCLVLEINELLNKALDLDQDYKNGDVADPAYILYTSGSTGKPKGVVIEQRSVANLCVWHQNAFDVSPLSRASIYAAVNFDAMVWELWPYVLQGASVCLLTEEDRLDFDRLLSVLKRERISHCFLPTGVWEALPNKDALDSAMTILTGGDKLRKPPERNLFNNYGPTETTVVATFASIEKATSTQLSLPIGKPIFNTDIFILDENGKLAPQGTAGEIHIGGAGLARGYLNNPELTHEKFVTNPFDSFQKVYKTGDIGKWTHTGDVVYHGRSDDQLKVRGFRIEPREIEGAIVGIGGAERAVVCASRSSSGHFQLMAYIVGHTKSVDDIRAELANCLPEYMIPNHLVPVNSFPLTSNGKIDFTALPQPAVTCENEVEPVTRAEIALSDVWKELLGRDAISINDNFFASGGDSISAMQVSARMYQLGFKLEVRNILRYPLLRDAAGKSEAIRTSEVSQHPVEGEVSLSPIQLYFFESKNELFNHFNQAMLLKGDEFTRERINDVVHKLMEHHDALRMSFQVDGGSFRQVSLPPQQIIPLAEYDYREYSRDLALKMLNEQATRVQESIDFSSGLVKCALFHLGDSDRLLIAIHHLIVDVVSWRIILEDVDTLLSQSRKGAPLTLPAKTTSYQKWSEKLHYLADKGMFDPQLPYWRRIGAHSEKMCSLSPDVTGSDNCYGDVSAVSFSLQEDQTEYLLTNVHRAYNTEITDFLLTALTTTLQRFTKMDSVLIGLEGHGREDIAPDIDLTRTVGWFTSLFPVALSCRVDLPPTDKLIEVKEQLRKIPMKGMGYSVLRYLKKSEQLPVNPLVRFNYLGQFNSGSRHHQFILTDEHKGKSISDLWRRDVEWDVTSFISDKKFFLSIDYSRRRFRRETMQEVVDTFRKQLNELINCCVDRNQSVLTPSDLGTDALTIDELNTLFD